MQCEAHSTADMPGWQDKTVGQQRKLSLLKLLTVWRCHYHLAECWYCAAGDNGRTAPYASLRRAESYLLPEGKCVRHVRICQPTLSPQFSLSPPSSPLHPHLGKRTFPLLSEDPHASDKLITIYRAQTYCAYFWSECVWCKDGVWGHTVMYTRHQLQRRGWTKLRLSERCSNSTKAVWNTWRKLSVNIPIHLKGSSSAGA